MSNSRRKKNSKPKKFNNVGELALAMREMENIDFVLNKELLFEIATFDYAGELVAFYPLQIAVHFNFEDAFFKIINVLKHARDKKDVIQKMYNNALKIIIPKIDCNFKIYETLIDLVGMNNVIYTSEETVDGTSQKVGSGFLPIHFACSRGSDKIIKHLIDRSNINLNVKTFGLCDTPLHVACKNGQEETVKLLLKYNECKIDEVNNAGCTPLAFAVKYRQINIIHMLIQANANVNSNSVLLISVRSGDLQIIDILLKNKMDVNEAFFFACQEGMLAAARYLKIKGALIRDSLFVAAEKNRTNIIEYLIREEGISVSLTDAEGTNALMSACLLKSTNAAELLIKMAKEKDELLMQLEKEREELMIALVRQKDETERLIQTAKENADIELIAQLEETRDKMDLSIQLHEEDNKNKPLINAKEKKQVVLHSLLNHMNINYNTPLLISFAKKDKTMVQLLLKHKPNITQQIRDGKTIIHYAFVLHGNDEIDDDLVNLLLKHIQLTNLVFDRNKNTIPNQNNLDSERIDINRQDDHGRTPLHVLVSYKKIKFLETLLNIGANINAKDAYDRTPLFCAAAAEYEQMVDALIAKGANVKDAIMAAISYNNLAAINALLKPKLQLDDETIVALLQLTENPDLKEHSYMQRVKNKLGMFIETDLQTPAIIPTVHEAEAPGVKKKPINNTNNNNNSNDANTYLNPYLMFQYTPLPSARAYYQSLGVNNDDINKLFEKKKEDENKNKAESEASATVTTDESVDSDIMADIKEVKEIRNAHKNVRFYCPDDIIPRTHAKLFNIDSPKWLTAPKGDQGIKPLKGYKFGPFDLYINGELYPERVMVAAELKTLRKEGGKSRAYLVELKVKDITLWVAVMFSPRGIHKNRDAKSLANTEKFAINVPLALARLLSKPAVKTIRP